MTKSKAKRVSLDELMSTRPSNSQRCATCSYDNPAFHKDVEKMAAAIKAGACRATRAGLYEWACEEYPTYDTSLSSFRQHLKRCLGVPPAAQMSRTPRSGGAS